MCSYAIAKSLQQQFVILRFAFVTRIATTDMVLLQCALCSYAAYLSVTRDILFNIISCITEKILNTDTYVNHTHKIELGEKATHDNVIPELPGHSSARRSRSID